MHLTFASYTLKENFTSSRLLKNENYTYLNHKAYINAVNREVVEDDGIEPTTPCLQSRCSPS